MNRLFRNEPVTIHYYGAAVLTVFGVLAMISGTIFTALKNLNCLTNCL